MSSLDAVRALGVIAVILAHIAEVRAARRHAWRSVEWLALNRLGQTALLVFFVISGFLITLILVAELDKRGRISLSRFYFRRAMRIIPPVYAYILAIAAAVALGWVSVPKTGFLAALTFTTDYCAPCAAHWPYWYLGHTWTLAIDAQFYLLWPLVLAFGGRRLGLRLAVAFLVISPLLRIWMAAHDTYDDATFFGLEIVADSVATGCLLALLRDRLHATRRYPTLLRGPFVVAILSTAFLLLPLADYHRRWSTYLFVIAVIPLVNLAIAIGLDWAMTYPMRPIGKLLNTRVLAFLGAISYSAYLWQQPFLFPKASNNPSLLVSVVLIAAASVASYYAVEKPSLQFRAWLEPKLFKTSTARSAARDANTAA